LHYNLANIPETLAREELSRSKTLLEGTIEKEVKSIAFPDGSYNDNVKKIALNCGYGFLLAVESRTASDHLDATIRSRLCISNTTTFESNVIQIHAAFHKRGY